MDFKMFKVLIILGGILILLHSIEAGVSSDYIRPSDQNRFGNNLLDGLVSNEASNIFYGLHGLHLLKKAVPPEKQNVACISLNNIKKEKSDLETIFYISSAAHYLSNCKGLLDGDHQNLQDVLSEDKYSILDIYYAATSYINMRKSIPNPSKVAQTLQTKLKTEDSITNLAYVFHIASYLGNSGKFAFTSAEETLTQADEVDGKMLQFEGGLSVTSLILIGLNKLYTSQQVPTVMTAAQAEKFVNYLISRRTVQTVKGVSSLIEAIRTFTDNPKLSPVSIGLAGSSQAISTISVRVSDVLGNPINLPVDSVIAQSATRLGDDVVVLAKQKLVATSNPTIFNLELPRDRMVSGLYKVVVSAGSHSSSLTITALATGVVSFLDIGIADADQISTAKLQKLPYPSKLPHVLEADTQQVLVLKFGIADSNTKKPLKIQQAFLKLTCPKTKQEIIFVSDCDITNNVYNLNLDIGSKIAEFSNESNSFSLSLILGDTILSNPIIWEIGELNVKRPTSSSSVSTESVISIIAKPIRGPKPEIKHLFRDPERRPPQTVSMFFTGLVVAPLILLFILWIKLGINVSNFKFSLSTLGFHLGLAGIFILYTIFWLSLNMFQTSRWLILLGAITFLAGHRLLKSVAEKRK